MCRTFPHIGETDCISTKLYPTIACQPTQYIAWQSKTSVPHPTNAVFFPSAQMKNVRHKPVIPTETQAIPARTQPAVHHVEVAIDDRTGIAQTILVQTTRLAVMSPPQRQPQREPRLRGSVVRCWRDRERFANPHYHVSDSDPFSLTAPARIRC